jgi:DNA-binding NtrC family response regulator
MIIACGQPGCAEPAGFRFTWPGQEEGCACQRHADHLRGVAEAMGFALQLTPVEPASVARTLEEIEQAAIDASLARHDGHKPAAAEELGISLKTLYNKLNQTGTLEKSA